MNDQAQNTTARTYWKIQRLGTTDTHHDAGVVDKFGRRVGFQVRITEQRWIPCGEGGWMEKGGKYAVMVTITRDGKRYGASQPEKQFDGFAATADYARETVAKRIDAARKKFEPAPVEPAAEPTAQELDADLAHDLTCKDGDACEAGDECEALEECAEIPGTHFRVRLVRRWERYGLDDCLTHGEADPLVEFYDTRYAHTHRGQFVSRYYRSTLLEHPQGRGLCLDGGIPEWSIGAEPLAFVRGWLTATV